MAYLLINFDLPEIHRLTYPSFTTNISIVIEGEVFVGFDSKWATWMDRRGSCQITDGCAMYTMLYYDSLRVDIVCFDKAYRYTYDRRFP